MRIPYGIASFPKLRELGMYYADKTHLLPRLEHPDTTRYVMFLRPRRFGKSLLISMLESYYDRAQADRFDALFGGLFIHRQPTPEQGQHLVLRFDFSTVRSGADEDMLGALFVEAVRRGVADFLQRYQGLAPGFYPQLAERLSGMTEASSILLSLFSPRLPHQFFVLIDEYDSFANELLSAQRADLYHKVVAGTGFVRSFFKTLKAEAGASGRVTRLLFTGVSPMALDDMASGFNISTQITMMPDLNALCGFTKGEVAQVVDAFLAETPELGPRDKLLGDLVGSYNGYLFSDLAEERICNPDMVLYYLVHLRQLHKPPRDLLDRNVRTDYGKLRQLASPPVGEAEQWHREILETIVQEGGITSPLVDSFGARHLYEPAHLVSLLFYMGLLTIDREEEGLLRLTVPNLVMRRMHWAEMTVMLREQAGVLVDVGRLTQAVSRMAYHGDLAAFLNLIQERVITVLSNRDLMQFDEKHLKMILLSYLSLSPIYRPLSEKEVAQGYSDLLLALDRRFPDAKYAYLLELKHLRTGATEEEVAKKRAEGEAQIRRYLRDEGLLPALLGERTILSAVVLYRGAKEHQICWVRAQ